MFYLARGRPRGYESEKGGYGYKRAMGYQLMCTVVQQSKERVTQLVVYKRYSSLCNWPVTAGRDLHRDGERVMKHTSGRVRYYIAASLQQLIQSATGPPKIINDTTATHCIGITQWQDSGFSATARPLHSASTDCRRFDNFLVSITEYLTPPSSPPLTDICVPNRRPISEQQSFTSTFRNLCHTFILP